jgi:hypothetical protein
MNKNFPSDPEARRNILTRACVERKVLVPDGQFSAFPYEDWDGTLKIRTASGKNIAELSGAWEVLDAIRYYNPASTNLISFFSDLCYEVTPTGNRARGGACDQMTDYGNIKGITYDSPASGFRGVHRGLYVNQYTIDNAGGSQYYYTDSFGNNAQTTPFKGSVRQFVSSVKAPLIPKGNRRIIQRWHDDGGNTVHWPN